MAYFGGDNRPDCETAIPFLVHMSDFCQMDLASCEDPILCQTRKDFLTVRLFGGTCEKWVAGLVVCGRNSEDADAGLHI